MALGDPYATLAELKARLGITSTADDARLTGALAAATLGVELACHRQFNDAGAASARTYVATTALLATVDDFSTTTGLVVAIDLDGDGVFETTLTIDVDFQVEPAGGVVGGVPGWPFWWLRIRSRSARRFPCGGGDLRVQVTARWGWAAVPAPVKEATLAGAQELFSLKEAPFGVAGFDQFGAIRVRDNPKIRGLLAGYRHAVVG